MPFGGGLFLGDLRPRWLSAQRSTTGAAEIHPLRIVVTAALTLHIASLCRSRLALRLRPARRRYFPLAHHPDDDGFEIVEVIGNRPVVRERPMADGPSLSDHDQRVNAQVESFAREQARLDRWDGCGFQHVGDALLPFEERNALLRCERLGLLIREQHVTVDAVEVFRIAAEDG